MEKQISFVRFKISGGLVDVGINREHVTHIKSLNANRVVVFLLDGKTVDIDDSFTKVVASLELDR